MSCKYCSTIGETAICNQRIAELEAELDAIKCLLPKTADGYTVFPGNIVWPLHEIDDEQGAEVVIMLRDVETEEILEEVEISDNYFKRQGKREQS